MEIIERKADNLFQSDDKAASLECYKLLHEIILELQQKLIVNEESKYFLSQQSKKMYEAAIKVAIANDDLEQAYQFSQSSRSMILLQQIQEKQAIKATGIPESVMKKRECL